MKQMIRIFSDPIEFEKSMEPQGTAAAEAEETVKQIISKLRASGDEGLLELRQRYDGVSKDVPIKVTALEVDRAYKEIDDEFLQALKQAEENITFYHKQQVKHSWFMDTKTGSRLGQLVRPLARVGIYVPGGTATYPSSVLMNAIPAKVAGVQEIAMVTPPNKEGNIPAPTLVAAAELGITEVYRVGGAQAIAALAYGTKTINKVEKISGPGNIYVTLAKKLVYGQVDIDMLAGPSEILIVADKTANPRFIAADLLSQAEHDALSRSILITDDFLLAQQVQQEVEEQLEQLSRKEIARRAIDNNGSILVENDWEEVWRLVNQIGPEHLELHLDKAWEALNNVRNAGAVFLGPYSPEPLGDYLAGPNHILPTGGTAKFYSPLGVDSFIKRSSVIAYSEQDFYNEASNIVSLAEVEGLDAHARAVKVRLEGK